MEYYNILNFRKEPFSNSPEPEFLFQSPQHTGCLQKLELSVRLRRGLNVVIGDIGTGKTTLCRKLIQNFSSTPADAAEIETHLLLDPSFNSVVEFLRTVALMLGIKDSDNGKSEWQLKEQIKDYLFGKGVDEKKIVVLVIDEGQKIPENCLEILREFLNYETNSFKLLQIIIFAQKEFKSILKRRANLFDRVNLLYYLQPLNFEQMRAMIRFRISVARDFEIAPPLFNMGGLAAIYLATGGYPRKVVALCHQILLKMIIRNRKKAGWFLVRRCVNRMATPLWKGVKWALASIVIIMVLGYSLKTFIPEYPDVNAYNQSLSPSPQIISGTKQLTPPANIVPASIKTASRPDSPVIEEEKKQQDKIPDTIGMLTIKKGMTLWWMLQNIYGEASPKIIEAVVRANHHIKNKDIIEEGVIITLPWIPAQVKPLKSGNFIVLLKEGKDIEIMYSFFGENHYRPNMPSLVLFPFWNKIENEIIFAVIIDKIFNNNQEAQKAINKLSPALAAKTKIISQWDADTVFFNRKALQR
ncbi:MAG: AAA family ATPase [Smithellaceae bacterium]|jgi:general secretion pathway protein A